MRNKHLLKIAIAAAILPLMAGCATFHQAHVKQVQAEHAITRYQPPAPPPVVTVTNTPFLMGTAVDVRHAVPTILKQSITLVSANPLTIREIGARISQLTSVPVNIDNQSASSATTPGATLPPLPSMSGNMSTMGRGSGGSNYAKTGIPLNWNGSVAGLLDYVTAKDGLWWKYRNGAVHVYRTETETFSIPALAWSTKASGSIIAAAGASGSSSSGGAGGAMGGSSGSSSQGNISTGTTDIVNTSSVNVWKNLEKTAQIVAGGAARVMADSSTGTLTVTGTPPQIGQVRQWVRGLTRQLERQVIISVHVYNVQMNSGQNYGLNLSGVFNNLGKQYGVSLQGVTPPTPTGGGMSNTTPMSLGASMLSSASGAANQVSGSQVAVQALATLGNVTQVFSRSAMSLNGEPAPIQVAQQTSYLAENSTMQTANVGSTSGLIPGTVTTGFTAIFLPRVDNGQVLLGMNMTISNLVSLNTISSGQESIEVPTVDSSTFQQSVSLKPGQTLLLTGYSQSGGNTSHNGVGSPYLPLLGGGANASTSKQMIAIVITARIL
ncbi:PilN family type IVB pilus formation outer membrane protein [Acidithiobacillus ferriphilus]|uniref:PilN family type IVB pilus formation outer membrane protein n=1 Tax=Acidithiobacillus ferriphilus TaxID=1689834 RepID=UPI002DBE62F5|nr:PilN family type IVB pilus formation outer membrane protein [Acidithiobacillus ferriphilus]MEB8476594.1 PilN family type IVB pilus formation outer membrane protein [Acidithiobacillus ferriphilus]